MSQSECAQPNEEKKFVSITEAAEINNVTRQAIYVAIKLNKLKAKRKLLVGLLILKTLLPIAIKSTLVPNQPLMENFSLTTRRAISL